MPIFFRSSLFLMSTFSLRNSRCAVLHFLSFFLVCVIIFTNPFPITCVMTALSPASLPHFFMQTLPVSTNILSLYSILIYFILIYFILIICKSICFTFFNLLFYGITLLFVTIICAFREHQIIIINFIINYYN